MTTSPVDPAADPENAGEPARPEGTRRRIVLFSVITAACVAIAAGYVGWAATRSAAAPAAADADIRLAAGAPVLLFQNLTGGDGGNQVGLVPLDHPGAPRTLTGLSCDRLHFASGHGLCLKAGSGFPPTEYAMIFGPDFTVTGEIALNGLPSRARVSPDGRYGATTVFVTGHSYSDAGLSTATTLIDMGAGTAVANLETFTIERDGTAWTAPDVNFWGVTFAADSNRFFATMATGGHTYLVAGDIAARHLVIGQQNVECPSLSPDGTRVAFKKRMDSGTGSPVWRFHVLDLATGRETPLAETRSVDDQIEWLDEGRVLYGSPDSARAVFSVPADGSGEPHEYLGQALSPTVLHTPLPDGAVAGLAAAPQVTVPSTDLGVTTTASPAEAAGGEPVTHTLTVTNHGPRDATRVVAEDVVTGPATISGATADVPAVAGGYGCAVFVEENRVRCDIPVLPAGSTWTVTVAIRTTGTGTVGGRALIGASEQDGESSNDIASVRTDVPQ
jgi:uncharacterized repeat protein (TIGR01451 family)